MTNLEWCIEHLEDEARILRFRAEVIEAVIKRLRGETHEPDMHSPESPLVLSGVDE